MILRIFVFSALLALSLRAQAQEPAATTGMDAQDLNPALGPASEVPAVRPIGYVDANRDGVNDRFADANGDGLNDIGGAPYPHRFQFADANADGANDVFVDRDGDGVNDLDARLVDSDKDGVCDNVIDHNGDGVNDITGAKYGVASLNGFRLGKVDEERGRIYRRFVDGDGDGMHDRPGRGRWGGGQMDRFVDEDGDGICDGRRITGRSGAEGTGQSRHRRGRPSPQEKSE